LSVFRAVDSQISTCSEIETDTTTLENNFETNPKELAKLSEFPALANVFFQ